MWYVTCVAEYIQSYYIWIYFCYIHVCIDFVASYRPMLLKIFTIFNIFATSPEDRGSKCCGGFREMFAGVATPLPLCRKFLPKKGHFRAATPLFRTIWWTKLSWEFTNPVQFLDPPMMKCEVMSQGKYMWNMKTPPRPIKKLWPSLTFLKIRSNFNVIVQISVSLSLGKQIMVWHERYCHRELWNTLPLWYRSYGKVFMSNFKVSVAR